MSELFLTLLIVFFGGSILAGAVLIVFYAYLIFHSQTKYRQRLAIKNRVYKSELSCSTCISSDTDSDCSTCKETNTLRTVLISPLKQMTAKSTQREDFMWRVPAEKAKGRSKQELRLTSSSDTSKVHSQSQQKQQSNKVMGMKTTGLIAPSSVDHSTSGSASFVSVFSEPESSMATPSVNSSMNSHPSTSVNTDQKSVWSTETQKLTDLNSV